MIAATRICIRGKSCTS